MDLGLSRKINRKIIQALVLDLLKAVQKILGQINHAKAGLLDLQKDQAPCHLLMLDLASTIPK